jgi:1-acyl-sn-glycerol-3-phosphate acyltransferase
MVSTFQRYFTRHMNALRIAPWGMPAVPQQGPVIVYSNHPAWWDAAVYILAADRFFPAYESYAPIDAAMLKQYGIFGRIGAFGVDLESPRGAADFLKAGAEILSVPNRALWITAQGRFGDVRERPLGLKRGAEAFIAFGEPLRAQDLLNLARPARLERLESELTRTLDHLSADVQSRDPARFRAVLEGRAGIGGLYDGWRRMAAALRGRTFDPSHEGRAS